MKGKAWRQRSALQTWLYPMRVVALGALAMFGTLGTARARLNGIHRGLRRRGCYSRKGGALAFAAAGAALFTRKNRLLATVPSFELLREEVVPEYKAECRLYEHSATKAQLLSIKSDDENKVFGITFRTPPRDSTGLPHILEHSVLCGSERYPTKEPFVELLKGSLQTFLNAFTYPDRTCYPVASQNPEDLKNLARVYMDAVFFPRARSDPRVLAQEGWHFELENDELIYKGVVFNEMKGVYSSPESIMQRAALRELFPDNAYRHDSGGDPTEIPNLSFDDFRAFHEEFYHPSNSRIFFYGDFPEEARLELASEYLDRFSEPKTSLTKIGYQKFRDQKFLKLKYPGTGKHIVTVNWLLAEEPLSPRDELGLAVLDHLLTGTSTALLRKTLTDSSLGESVTGGGLSDELIQPTFSIGLKGVDAQKAAQVEPLILKTLASATFSNEDVAASMNTIEFQLREFNTGSFPKGLSFMLGCLRNWIYDRDPLEPLKFEEPLKQLKAIATPEYFSGLLASLFGSHRVTIEMVPDAGLEAETAAAERAKLRSVTVDKEKIRHDAEELERIQSEPDPPEALATIPTLRVEDLEKEIKTIPREKSLVNGITVLSRNLPTAGIAYVDVALDMRALPISELELVPLFARCLLETGIAGKFDAAALQREIGSNTGGIDATIVNTMRVDDAIADPEDLVYRLVLRGKATVDKTSHLVGLLQDILVSADFSQHQRMFDMLKESKARYESMFRTSGNSFAAIRLSARLTRSGYCAEKTSGVSHYHSVLELLKEDPGRLQARLEKIRSILLAANDPVINLTSDTDVDVTELSTIFTPSEPPRDWSSTPLLSSRNEAFVVPTQVNYVAKGGRFYAPGEKPRGSDSVVRRVISLDYLWNEVRVKGGAYGGGCSLNPISGAFAFSSYRDPNLERTLSVYERTTDYVTKLQLSKNELDKAIIASIGELDSPLNPDQKGFLSLRHYLDGTSDSMRQTWRDQVLSTELGDFGTFNAKLEAFLQDSSAVVFTSKDAVESLSSFHVIHLT